MRASKLAVLVAIALAFVPFSRDNEAIAGQSAPEPRRVKAIRVQILSTMLADAGIGEWGFAALVEVDGKRILFDTGARPETVLQNAREMKVDLASITDVILSHNHGDHTIGLMTLRRELAKQNPAALSRAHVGRGIFWSRPTRDGGESNHVARIKAEYEATGGKFIEYDKPAEIAPGVWLTGPVPRVHPERNWGLGGVGGQLRNAAGAMAEDTIPEDMSLVMDTAEGLVLISGCGHAGIINTIEHARASVRKAPVHSAIGGFHLLIADDAKLNWTADKLKEFGLGSLMGAHCTGIEAVYRIRERAGLDRARVVVGAVGATFTLGKGFDPRALAR